MAARDQISSSDALENGEDGEEVIEERKEYITNPDGTVTVKTIKVISTYVEEEEEEEEEEEDMKGEENTKDNKEDTKDNEEEEEVTTNGRPPMPSFSDLSKEEMEDFMRFAAEKKLMAKMEEAGFVPMEDGRDDDDESKAKKKKKRPDAEKRGKKKKRRDGKENKMDELGGCQKDSSLSSGISNEEFPISTHRNIQDIRNIQNSNEAFVAVSDDASSCDDDDDKDEGVDLKDEAEFSGKTSEFGGISSGKPCGFESSKISDGEYASGNSEPDNKGYSNVPSVETHRSLISEETNQRDLVSGETHQDFSMETLRNLSSVSSSTEATESSLVPGDRTSSSSAPDEDALSGTSEDEVPTKGVTELNKTEDDDELYGINVKQLATSFLSAAGDTDVSSTSAGVGDLPPNLPPVSHLVEAYKNSPSKPTDPCTPDDIPVGLSLQSIKSAYEASAVGGGGRRGASPLQEEGLQLSFSQMRAAYCNVVSQSGLASSPASQPANHEPGHSVRDLRASYGDLTALADGGEADDFISSKLKDPVQVCSDCKACGKQVFQMEKIVAEKAAWHKNCFRCKECNKNLTLETYQSHEGVLYCKPHFKELFRPKAVVEDPTEARKERPTSKPDYGLEELAQLNVRQKFSMFERPQQEEEVKLEPVAVRRSQSMISRAARFLAENGSQDYGVDNSELGEYDEDEDEEEDGEEEDVEEEEEEMEEEGVDEDGEPIIIKTTIKKKKTKRSAALTDAQQQRTRREQMSRSRKEELGRFRQMLCAGKNTTLKERFETGQFENEERPQTKEEIKIDEKRAARSLKAKFEQGQPFILDDDMEVDLEQKRGGEREEVEEVFKEAETASRARNLFKHIDSKVNQDGSAALLRSQSFAASGRENRRSVDGLATEDVELGRDPNLIRCTDNYQDEVDCRKTKSILTMFKKMEAKNTGNADDEDEDSEGEDYDDEYTDEEGEYTDEEGDYTDEEDDEERARGKAPYKDELLQMSARKAADLRAKFEKWELEEDRHNAANRPANGAGEEEEAMPSLDTARNLKAMFEEKAQEAAKPQVRERPKVNRFVGGGGDQCPACNKTVYAMEKFEVQGKIIHKTCFKCCKCNSPLSMVTFTMGGGKLYCNSHYKQLFTEKGNYDSILSGSGATPIQQ